ncbi:MAG: hypothetical protein AB7L09_00930 [Nitrospira sp.]
MNDALKPLAQWQDNPHISWALARIEEGNDTTEALVDALVAVAEHARYAEDYMVIHRLRDCKERGDE